MNTGFPPGGLGAYGPAARGRGLRSVADIFDELNEDLRAERVRALTARYGALGLAALVVVVLCVGGWEGWRWWQNRQSAAAAAPFTTAMRDADALAPGSAAAKLATAADGFAHIAATAPAGYRTLAQLREAALRWDAGNTAAALSLWDQIAADASVDHTLRDLGNLLWAQHQVDAGDPLAVTAHIKPLEAPGNAWRPLAQEVEALLDIRTDDKPAATKILRALAVDPSTTDGVRGRANGLLTLLGDTGAKG